MKKAFVCFIVFLLFPFLNIDSEESVNPPDIIVFDFGGVVGKTDFTALASKVRHQLRIPHSSAKKIVSKVRKLNTEKDRDLFWKQYQYKTARELPLGWQQTYNSMKSKCLGIDPEITKIIKALKKNKCKVALLSNIGAKRARMIRKKGLYTPFKPTVLSCDIKVEKPRKKAYKILLKKLGNVDPQRCFFIDDKNANVIAARSLGIQAVQFHSPAELRRELEKRNILPSRKKR